jgi:hypothetical protein
MPHDTTTAAKPVRPKLAPKDEVRALLDRLPDKHPSVRRPRFRREVVGEFAAVMPRCVVVLHMF